MANNIENLAYFILASGKKKAFIQCLLLACLAFMGMQHTLAAQGQIAQKQTAEGLYKSASQYARTSDNGNGAVASVHPLATQAGLDALQRGGNAIDAAVATALTLGVVDSHNSGIGGGNFAVIHFADGTVQAIDGREMAPQAAHRDMYIRKGEAQRDWSKTGALAIGIPGSVAVYDYILKHGGKFSLKDWLLPAAQLAEQGFPLSQVSHDRLIRSTKKLAQFPATAKILLDSHGNPWPVGHQLQQQDLAATYRQLAEQGVDYFYRGEFAQAVEQWMRDNGGIVSKKDFANYKMLVRQPVYSEYRGYGIYGFPPPSSGGIHVAQILNILENFEVKTLSAQDRYHLLAEAMKLAFADRAHYLGDADFVPVPRGLIDQGYADSLAKKISLSKQSSAVSYGTPPGADVDLFGKHTTHISTADKWGNWVAITTTVNTSFGSKVIIPGTGVIMNNQMDDFSIQPGVPNAFGLVGNEANNIQPGKRPLSSMSPTIVVHKGKPVISIGAAGGPTIITQVVQGLVNLLDLGMTVDESLQVPRVHQQWAPDITFVEEALPQTVKDSLQQRGHKLHARGFAGSSQLIMQTADGKFQSAAEPRIILRNKQ